MDQMSKKGSQSNTSVKGTLPGNFFDYGEEDEAPAPVPKELSSSQNVASSIHTKVKGVPDGFFDHNKTGSGMQPNEPSSETAQAKGSLPEGFFDNKDADLRARGIQPKKVDMKEVLVAISCQDYVQHSCITIFTRPTCLSCIVLFIWQFYILLS
jgi:zinc finger protein 830